MVKRIPTPGIIRVPAISTPDQTRHLTISFCIMLRWILRILKEGLSLLCSGKRHQPDYSCPFNCLSEHPLMACTIARYPARNNLPPFSGKIPECSWFFIIYFQALICTESAKFPSVINPSFFTVRYHLSPHFPVIFFHCLNYLFDLLFLLQAFLFWEAHCQPPALTTPRGQPCLLI